MQVCLHARLPDRAVRWLPFNSPLHSSGSHLRVAEHTFWRGPSARAACGSSIFARARLAKDLPLTQDVLLTEFETSWPAVAVQVFILDSLATYTARDAKDAEAIVERVTPRLQHANCAVVLSAVKVTAQQPLALQQGPLQPTSQGSRLFCQAKHTLAVCPGKQHCAGQQDMCQDTTATAHTLPAPGSASGRAPLFTLSLDLLQ